MDARDLAKIIDRHHPTWLGIEQFLNDHIKKLHETLEVPRETGLERVDQGQLALCRILLDAAKPSRPDGERSPNSGTDYGMQGV